MDKKLLSAKEAAILLGISKEGIRKKVKRGELPVAEYRVIHGKKAPLFRLEDLIANCQLTANLRTLDNQGNNCQLPTDCQLTANCQPTPNSPKSFEYQGDTDKREGKEDVDMHPSMGAFCRDVRKQWVHTQPVDKSEFFSKFEEGEWWLRIKGLVQLLGANKSTILRKIYRGEFTKVRTVYVGKKKKCYEIALSCLPEGARKRFFEVYLNRTEQGLEQMRKEINLPPDPTEQDIKRMWIVYEALRAPDGKKDAYYEEIGKKYGVSKKTVYKLLQKYREGTLFKRRERPGEILLDIGIEVRGWDREAAEFAVGLILENRWDKKPAKTLYKELVRWAATKEFKIGSYVSFTRLAKAVLGTPLKTLRDKGKRGVIETVAPEIKRDFSAYEPFELLVGDQHKDDYVCFDDELNPMWLEGYFWMDARTGLVFPAFCYKHYSRFEVGLSLKEALIWGIPKELYNDWGKCENSLYIKRLRGRLSKMVRLLGKEEIVQRHAQARRPQSKPIEGLFAHLDRMLRAKDIPGHAKRDLKDQKANELKQAELKQLIKTRKLLHYKELMEEILHTINEWNWHRYKNRQIKKDNGRSPWEIFKEENSGIAGLSEEAAQWLVLPEPKQKIKVRNSKVSFKHPYFGEVSFFARELADVNGLRVDVRYYPFNADKCFVLIDNEVILCERWGLIKPKDELEVKDKIRIQDSIVEHFEEIMQRYRSKVKAYVRDKMKVSRLVPEIVQAKKAEEKVKKMNVRKETKLSQTEIYDVIIAARR